MNQDELALIKQALMHLEKSKELHDFGDMKAHDEARRARELLAKVLAGEAGETKEAAS